VFEGLFFDDDPGRHPTAIAKLSSEDRRKLRLWLAEFEVGQAEHSEPKTMASELGRLAGRAVADNRKRMWET
jgi:hypothetical protein